MTFYNKNMELIENNHSYLYKNLINNDNNYTNRLDNIETIYAKDGEKIVSITYKAMTYRLNSIYRPIEEAIRWSDQFTLQNINTVVSMYGLGNGIFARALLRKMEESHLLIIYEPSYDIFSHVIKNYDLSEILSDKRVVIAVEGANDFSFHITVKSAINITNMKSQIQCIYPNYDKIFAESCITFFNEIKEGLVSNTLNINTTIKLSEKYIQNIFKNLTYLIDSSNLKELKKYTPKEVPAIVVAAGPSVEENIEELKKAKGKAVIFACDRVLDYLLDYGLEPDFTVTIDPVKELIHFSRRDDVNIPLICTMEANNDILSRHIGKKIFCTSNPFLNGIYDLVNKEASEITTSGSVAIVAYTACVELGYKRVILVGQDLAFNGNVSHVGGEINNKGEEANVMVEGIDGSMIKSRVDWKEFVNRYQDLIALNNDIEVIDAKERGARIKGTIVMPLKEAVARYCREIHMENEDLFNIEPIFYRKDIGKIIDYLEGYVPIMNSILDEAESAIRKCNNVIREYERGLSSKKLNEALRKLSKVNKFIEEQSIYPLMDYHITAQTAPQLSEMLILSDDSEDYNLSTFQKSKIIYQATIDTSKFIKQALLETIDNYKEISGN
ncbi:MAG: motility associated factor glycosyltransferase family protein [Clostridiales bacterium]|jgi:hypothetical protein|nr:motility associated factor glycosyltransferase family protein [Clostridiales bacterium]